MTTEFPSEIIPTSEGEMTCGGYLFQENGYSFNYVCPVYGGGIVEFECVGINADANVTNN